jgi:hypothetical protein
MSLWYFRKFDIIAGLHPNNVFMYYEVIQTVMLADSHNFKLVLNIPLKSLNRQFFLYRMVVLPLRVSNNTFVQFEIGKGLFWN